MPPQGLTAGGGPPRVLLSDLFDQLPRAPFAFVVINPPFYPRNPRTLAERAWFCGKDFDYFEKLFRQIGDYLRSETKVLMTLSEDCDIPRCRPPEWSHPAAREAKTILCRR